MKIKNVLLTFFAFLQIQTFAFNHSSDLWKSVSLKEETNGLLFNYNTTYVNKNDEFKPDFLVQGNYFSLASEVIGGECYASTVNANTKKIKYTLKNISGSAITLVGRNSTGNKIQFDFNGISYSTLSPSNIMTDAILGGPYFLSSQTIAANAEIVFELNLSNSTADAIQTYLTVTYGTSTGAIAISEANTIENLIEKNTVYKTLAAPGTLIKQLNQASYYTLATASGLSSVEKYKFYDASNNILSSSLPVKMQNGLIALGTYVNGVLTFSNYFSSLNLQYTISNGPCESAKSNYFLSAYTGSVPNNPGTIKSNVNAICYNGTYVVDNNTLGKLSTNIDNSILSNYSWEISYDNGASWIVPTNSSLTTITGTNPSNYKITFNTLTQKVSVRRKYKETGSADLEYAYSNVVSVEVAHNKIDFPYDWDVYYVPMGSSFTLPTPITTYPSNIEIRNASNVVVTNNFTAPNAIGEHTFTYNVTLKNPITVSGVTLNCVSTRKITVVVYDIASCNMTKKRTFATIAKPWASGLSGVANPNNAVNNNRANYATITGGLVIAGLGTVGLDLYFTKTDGSLFSGAE